MRQFPFFTHTHSQQILQRTDKLFRHGSSLESEPHANREAVSQLMGKVKHLMGDFDRRLSFRKKKLSDSVRLHQLTESVSVRERERIYSTSPMDYVSFIVHLIGHTHTPPTY